MPQDIMNVTEYIYKRDIDMMMQVNSKAVELQAAVADQNEEIIEMLKDILKQNERMSNSHKDMDKDLAKIVKANEDLAKDLFKFQILAISGFVAIILQIVSAFLKK